MILQNCRKNEIGDVSFEAKNVRIEGRAKRQFVSHKWIIYHFHFIEFLKIINKKIIIIRENDHNFLPVRKHLVPGVTLSMRLPFGRQANPTVWLKRAERDNLSSAISFPRPFVNALSWIWISETPMLCIPFEALRSWTPVEYPVRTKWAYWTNSCIFYLFLFSCSWLCFKLVYRFLSFLFWRLSIFSVIVRAQGLVNFTGPVLLYDLLRRSTFKNFDQHLVATMFLKENFETYFIVLQQNSEKKKTETRRSYINAKLSDWLLDFSQFAFPHPFLTSEI